MPSLTKPVTSRAWARIAWVSSGSSAVSTAATPVGSEGDLAVVIGGAPEQGRQALAHAHDFATLVEMGIHARHMFVQESSEIGRIGFCRRPRTTGDFLDGASDLVVPHEHLHVHAHVHARRTAESGAVGAGDPIRQGVQPRFTDNAA